MALVNAVLAQWARGLVWVTDGPSIAQWVRHEGYLAVGAAQSEADAVRMAQAYLATRAQPTVTTTVGLEPRGLGDEPGVDFGTGDYLGAPDEADATVQQRVAALTLSDDPDVVGGVVEVPELRSLQVEQDAATQLWLKRMANGALGGTSRSASPSPAAKPPEPSATKEVPPFSLATVAVSVSQRWVPPIAMRISRLVATLSTVGAGPTTVVVRKNGVAVPGASFTWEGVPGTQGLRVAIDVTPADYLETQVTAAGVGAQNLIVQPTGV